MFTQALKLPAVAAKATRLPLVTTPYLEQLLSLSETDEIRIVCIHPCAGRSQGNG